MRDLCRLVKVAVLIFIVCSGVLVLAVVVFNSVASEDNTGQSTIGQTPNNEPREQAATGATSLQTAFREFKEEVTRSLSGDFTIIGENGFEAGDTIRLSPRTGGVHEGFFVAETQKEITLKIYMDWNDVSPETELQFADLLFRRPDRIIENGREISFDESEERLRTETFKKSDLRFVGNFNHYYGSSPALSVDMPPERLARSDDLRYKIEGDQAAIAYFPRDAAGELVIPRRVGKKLVTKIHQGSFHSCESLLSIVIPDSVTQIGDLAFMNCRSLAAIRLSDKLTAISNYAFAECISLKDIVLPQGITAIGFMAFSNCRNLSNIILPDSIQTIGAAAFNQCHGLEHITIGKGVTKIEPMAFLLCTGLTRVTFLGDAPAISDEGIFEDAAPTIYRKNEAKGWGDTFAGRPVKLISEKP